MAHHPDLAATRLKRLTRRNFCAGAALVSLAGCASTPTLVKVPGGATLGLEVLAPPPDVVMPIANLSFGSSATAGGTGGATIGALSGLGCGPLVFLCVPLGAMIGLATGAGAGAVVGLAGALSPEQTTRLRDRMARLALSHDLRAELHNQLMRRAVVRWSVGTAKPDYSLSVALRGLSLTSTRDEQISLIAEAGATLQRNAGPATQSLSQKTFRFISAASPLALWLDEHGDLPDTLLGNASAQLAAQIIGELAAI